jgi:hypothetical protein
VLVALEIAIEVAQHSLGQILFELGFQLVHQPVVQLLLVLIEFVGGGGSPSGPEVAVG